MQVLLTALRMDLEKHGGEQMRTITLHFTSRVNDNRVEGLPSTLQIEEALGYLITWCPVTYNKVDIYPDPKSYESEVVVNGARYANEKGVNKGALDMQAVYSSTENDKTYVIGAVFDGKQFGFHS